MKNDQDQNSTDSAEIEALITRIERGQLRDGDAQLLTRLSRLQESFGVPLPESIQFERCEAVADAALPVFRYLHRLAADGDVIYSDDTRVKILSCLKENKELKAEERRGTHTSDW